MKKHIWIYFMLASAPLLLVAIWILIWSPLYLLDYFSSDGSSYGEIAFYHIVGWLLIGLYAIKAHLALFFWWGILISYIMGKLLYRMYLSRESTIIKKATSQDQEGLLEELEKDDF